MSAITGIYTFNRTMPIEEGKSILKHLQRYYADSSSFWCKDSVFLGSHTRWITPESVGKSLPYYDEEKRLVIVADCILDNREELAHILQLRTSDRNRLSDSQLILEAYQKWGEETPMHLLGDFTFIIWDEKKKQLFGARDFSGSRTLYFHKNHEQIAFCTAINPLLDLPIVKKNLNEEWLAEFLAIPGMNDAVDAESTVYESIKQIPPSHSFSVNNGEMKLTQYSHITFPNPLVLKSIGEYVEAFQEVFQKAVYDRLRTHHPVGSFLSGGLDSGSVVSFAARELKKKEKPLYTFSSVPLHDFEDWTPGHRMADERPFIQSTVDYVGNINEHYLDCQGQNSFTEIDEWLDIMEMPYKFFENSFWLKAAYEKARQEKVGVLLSGARGNFTVSWGITFDYYAQLLKKMKWVQLYKELFQYSRNMEVPRSRVMKVVGKKAFPMIRNIFEKEQEGSSFPFINPDFAEKTDVFNKLQAYGIDVDGKGVTDRDSIRIQHFQQLFSWSTTGTADTKLSLNYGLQGRDPTNDLRVIQYCLSVPSEQYAQNGLDRALIRNAMENYLPDTVRLNQRVRGIQAADSIHRMLPDWKQFISQVEEMRKDQDIFYFINKKTFENAIATLSHKPSATYAFSEEFKILMRSLILYRFIQRFL